MIIRRVYYHWWWCDCL